MIAERVEELLKNLREWGRERAILGIARVGSNACGVARPVSDVAVVILLDDPLALAGDADWMARFGSVRRVSDEDWGPIKAKRVQYADGNVMEFAFASPEWAATEPCDAGTLTAIKTGVRVVYDPKGLLRNLAIAARPDPPERHVLRSACGRYERYRFTRTSVGGRAASSEPRNKKPATRAGFFVAAAVATFSPAQRAPELVS